MFLGRFLETSQKAMLSDPHGIGVQSLTSRELFERHTLHVQELQKPPLLIVELTKGHAHGGDALIANQSVVDLFRGAVEIVAIKPGQGAALTLPRSNLMKAYVTGHLKDKAGQAVWIANRSIAKSRNYARQRFLRHVSGRFPISQPAPGKHLKLREKLCCQVLGRRKRREPYSDPSSGHCHLLFPDYGHQDGQDTANTLKSALKFFSKGRF